jgi:hypothetical protein
MSDIMTSCSWLMISPPPPPPLQHPPIQY